MCRILSHWGRLKILFFVGLSSVDSTRFPIQRSDAIPSPFFHLHQSLVISHMKVHAGSDADWEARAGASQSQRHLSSDVEKGDPSKPSRRDFAQRLAALAVSGDLPVHKRTHRVRS